MGFVKNIISIIAPWQLNGPMSTYSGKIHGVLLDFTELLHHADTLTKEFEQHSIFFILMALYGLLP